MSIFEKLKDYIENDISMQHIYQPVMLIELLKNQGSAAEQGKLLIIFLFY